MGRAVPMMAAALSTYTAGLAADRHRRGRERDDALERAVALQLSAVCDSAARRRRSGSAALAGSLPFVAAMKPVDGTTAAYVCRDFTCRQPVTTVDALKQELELATALT